MYLEQPMYRLRGVSFVLNERTEDQDEYFWREAMSALSHTKDPKNPTLLMSELPFRREFNHWINRVLDRWLETEFDPKRDATLARQHSDVQGKERLTPYEALKCKLYFSTRLGMGHSRILWLVAKTVAEFDAVHDRPSQRPHPAVLEGVHELMRIWHLSMVLSICSSAPMSHLREIIDTPKFNWSFLPESTALIDSLRQHQHRGAIRVSLRDIMKMLVTSSFAKPYDREITLQKEVFDIESSAVVTLGMLQNIRTRPGGANAIKDYEPWMLLVENSIKNLVDPGVPNTLTMRMLELDAKDSKRQYFNTIIDNLHLNQKSLQAGQGPIQKAWEHKASSAPVARHEEKIEPRSEDAVEDGLLQVAAPNSSSSQTTHMTYLAIKRLGRAVEERNVKAADRVRYDVDRFKSQNQKGTNKVPQELYEHLIYSFLRLRQIRTSKQIWEEMVAEGYMPRLKSYTTMMRGSQSLRDLNSMEFFWHKMRQANIQPDATAWSTRIAGLLRYEHVDHGLKALSEMGQNWLVAAKQAYVKQQGKHPKRGKSVPEVTAAQLLAQYKGDVGDVPRPDVVIMNSAIAPLSRGPDHLIPKVLAWGRSFGIEPDVITYNALIHVAMRHNQGAEALKILQRMRDRNIEVDSNTWTIILTDMLVGGYLDDLSSEEQQNKVLQFLSLVEAEGGQGLDQKGYALLLDRLLKNYENQSAAQAVLTHMASKDIQPSRHIYTILMDSHLQQSPPNFAAADVLWEHIHTAAGGHGAALDSKFFDLVIKGYAPYHATVGLEKLLSVLDRMEKDGKSPSWAALEATARALAERREWARMAQVVDRARRRLRDERGIDNGPGQWSFWQFVISTGMLRHERITTPEQIMGTA